MQWAEQAVDPRETPKFEALPSSHVSLFWGAEDVKFQAPCYFCFLTHECSMIGKVYVVWLHLKNILTGIYA